MDGSSSTYSTPVVLFRTARASCMRWRSPVESVEAARSSERYERPSSISRRDVSWNDSHIRSAIGRIGLGKDAGTPRTQSSASANVISHALSSGMPRKSGARARSDRRVPPQSGHGPSFRNFATRFMLFSSFTFLSAFSTVWMALKKVKSISPERPSFLI